MKKRGQATIEVTVALAMVLVLLLGTLKIFLWVNERIVRRQVDYETGPGVNRVIAGSAPAQSVIVGRIDDATEADLRIPGEVIPDESGYPQLNIFK